MPIADCGLSFCGRRARYDLVKHCKADVGYAALRNVVTKEKSDRMHSFLFAETLKYLYLLFEPKALKFEKVIFNTETHPIQKVR